MPASSIPINLPPVALISLLRGSTGLVAWMSNTPDDSGAAALSRIALSELSPQLFPQRDALLADWQSVCAARELDSVWPAFWRVFWSTLTEAQDQAPLAMPQRVATVSKPAATAAHPRAFRGTKFQPPKPATPVLNLAAWLGDDRLLDGFFARHDFDRLPGLDANGQPFINVSGQAPTVAGLLARSLGVEPEQWPALPEAFRRCFLWQLRMRPLRDVLAWLAIWRGLGGCHHGPQLALPSRLCALEPDAYEWAALALNLSPARQIVFMEAMLKHSAYLLPRSALSAEHSNALDAEAADDQRFEIYLDAVLSNLNRGVSAVYTLRGCALANRITEPHRIERLYWNLRVEKECAEVPLEDIYRMSKAVGEDRNFWELSVWEKCGTLPGFEAILKDTCWERLEKDIADRWLALFAHVDWQEENEQKILKRWRIYVDAFPEWHRVLATLSGPWQEKCMQMLWDQTNGWEDLDRLRMSVPHLLPLQQRMCRAPFAPTVRVGAVLSSLAENASDEAWRELAAAGDRTWLMIERACRRDNDASLTSRGIYSLGQCWPDFLMRAFSAAPGRLMRTARLLGSLAYERRRQFLSETAHNVWFITNWTAIEPYEACRTLYRLCLESGLNSPVPRRLRDHFESRTTLTEQQIERHCRVSLTRLSTVLLDALEQSIWRHIDMPFNLRAHSAAANHAVRFLAGLDRRDNRSGLRRFLLAYAEGRPKAYLDHPLNRAWFARHPKINSALWSKDPQAWIAEGADEIHIAIETDPLEILMLGTYVGSCLGLGGIMQHSSVACLLDANKKVVYARDASGRVLARQLLAIDERDRLVCFEVYPLNASETLKGAFRKYGQALADTLGIERYRHQEGASYDIEIILAQYWWDDGLWNESDHVVEPVSKPS